MNVKWPLMHNNISRSDANSIIDFLSQDPLPILTNSSKVREFENKWGEWLGTKYNVMVNSGSAANELSLLYLKYKFPQGGEVIVPPMAWVSDVAAILQNDFTPVFCDIKLNNLALDIEDVYGETGYVTNERNSIRPTLDVNGIWGGYTGEGAKTVIASKAFAKISMRLVPNQDWVTITELFTKHFTDIAPAGVTVKVTPHHGGQGYVTPTDSIGYKAANKAYTETFGVPAIPVRSGGSIPIVALFEKELKSKTILMGFGLDSDAIHSPNEHFGIFNYLKGIETIPQFYHYFTQMSK